MDTRKNESGIIVIAFLFLVTLIIFGFVVYNSISKSREAERVKNAASEAIDAAQDTVETVNNATRQASDVLGN